METAREVLAALARRHAFGEVEALVGAGAGGLPAGRPAEAAALCAFGQRVLDLDAEDFGMPEAAGEVPRDLLNRARASRMPQTPKEQPRGALATLRPAYALLLEIIAVRWLRREMAALVAAVHIAGEYGALLAWEPVLGHAGDPALLGAAVQVPGSRFGVPLEPGTTGTARRCDHTRPERSAAERALRVAAEPPAGWRAYLDRQHSQVARGLGVCAASCRTPCAVLDRLDDKERAALTERCKLATDFTGAALVKLRHAAPVGHGFGVPSPEEVQQAWARTRSSLRHQRLGGAALRAAKDDPYPLPGLPALFSAMAGTEIVPETLLHDVTERLLTALR